MSKLSKQVQINTLIDEVQRIKRKLGMAGTEPECICYPDIPGSHRACPIHGKKRELKCTCPPYWVNIPGTKHHKDCPLYKTPDLPLNARVAMALPETQEVCYDTMLGIWFMRKKGQITEWVNVPIPDYDKHRDLAMGALEEYCEKNHLHYLIQAERQKRNEFFFYCITIGHYHEQVECDITATSLMQAICEAIAKHAEGL